MLPRNTVHSTSYHGSWTGLIGALLSYPKTKADGEGTVSVEQF